MKLYDDATDEFVEVPRTKAPIFALVNGEYVEYEEGKYIRADKVIRVETITTHPRYGKSELELSPGEGMGTSVWSDLPPLTILAALNMALQNGRKGPQDG